MTAGTCWVKALLLTLNEGFPKPFQVFLHRESDFWVCTFSFTQVELKTFSFERTQCRCSANCADVSETTTWGKIITKRLQNHFYAAWMCLYFYLINMVANKHSSHQRSLRSSNFCFIENPCEKEKVGNWIYFKIAS